MKNRLIVAAIGIPALLAVIFFTPIWGWGIVVAIMAAFCAWELLHTAMPKFVPRFAVYAGVCGAAIVLGAAFGKSELVFKIAAYVLFVTMFVEMMISFHKSERIPFQDLALVFTAGIVIPWMLSSLVRLGLNDPKAPYLLLPFVITWLSDSGAGVLLTYHSRRLFPRKSPYPAGIRPVCRAYPEHTHRLLSADTSFCRAHNAAGRYVRLCGPELPAS